MLLCCFFFILSCAKDLKEIVIEKEIQPYVDDFIKEAALRGKKIDFSDTGLSIKFEDTPINAGGVCSELGDGTSGNHNIKIALNVWKRYIPQQRKRLIFHELGHCELNRPHDNTILQNEEWKSIMRGDPIPAGRDVLVNFTGFREKYYIDELFDKNIATPEWASKIFGYTDVIEKEIVVEKSFDKDILFEQFTLDESRNFQIEVGLSQTNGYGIAGFRWGPGGESEDMSIYFYEGDKLFLSSGQLVAYDLYLKKFDKVVSIDEHLFTIRKIDNIYYYFIDKYFLYQTSYFPMDIKSISTFVNSNVKVQYYSLKISYL